MLHSSLDQAIGDRLSSGVCTAVEVEMLLTQLEHVLVAVSCNLKSSKTTSGLPKPLHWGLPHLSAQVVSVKKPYKAPEG